MGRPIGSSSLAVVGAAARLMGRASALSMSAMSLLDGGQNATLSDEHLLAYEGQWKALRQLAFAQDSAGGQRGTEIVTWRRDPKGGFTTVFAPEGQRFKNAAKLSEVGQRCLDARAGPGQPSKRGFWPKRPRPCWTGARQAPRTGLVYVRLDAGSFQEPCRGDLLTTGAQIFSGLAGFGLLALHLEPS